jgi:hypothetical protein
LEEKTNETPKLPAVLVPLPRQATAVTTVALCTQKVPAGCPVEAKQAYHVFIAKDNQLTLCHDITDLHLQSPPTSAHHPR